MSPNKTNVRRANNKSTTIFFVGKNNFSLLSVFSQPHENLAFQKTLFVQSLSYDSLLNFFEHQLPSSKRCLYRILLLTFFWHILKVLDIFSLLRFFSIFIYYDFILRLLYFEGFLMPSDVGIYS